MKYYLIAGEASGDLHASHLMRALKVCDAKAEFRYFGGDCMAAEGGTLVKHYRELAYMGFIPVILHLRTILKNMEMCKQDICQWQPDVVILVDYPGFNLKIAKYVRGTRRSTSGRLLPKGRKNEEGGTGKPQIYYYIAPKLWAWKEYRIKSLKRDVDELFSILPFEVDFFEKKHHYPIHYVGNPTAQEVRDFTEKAAIGNDDFLKRNGLEAARPIIALLCGSRRQEIRDNLPPMLEVADGYADDYQIVVAGAPSIDYGYYKQFTENHHVTVLPAGNTYHLLYNAKAALVTSGTATLETALFRVPQVVCYKLRMARFFGIMRKLLLKVRWVSLVNLIANREMVRELVADSFSVDALREELQAILSGERRERMLRDYEELHSILGNSHAPEEAAKLMTTLLNARH